MELPAPLLSGRVCDGTGQTTEYGEKIMPPLQAMHKHRNYLHQGP